MSNILDGRKLAQEIELILQQAIESGVEVAKRPPGLAVLRVGNDPASGVYVNYKEKACERIGVRSFAKHLKEDISLEELTCRLMTSEVLGAWEIDSLTIFSKFFLDLEI